MAEEANTSFDEEYRGRCMFKVMIEDPNSTTGKSIRECADTPPELLRNGDESRKCVYGCKKGTREDAVCLDCYRYHERTHDNKDIIRSRQHGFISLQEKLALETGEAARQSKEKERELIAKELRELEETREFLSEHGIKRMEELRRLLGKG